MVLLDGGVEDFKGGNSRRRPKKPAMSAEQMRDVEARVNAMMSSMSIVATSSSAQALDRAARIMQCEETPEQIRKKSVAAKTASHGTIEFKRDFAAMGIDLSIKPRRPATSQHLQRPRSTTVLFDLDHVTAPAPAPIASASKPPRWVKASSDQPQADTASNPVETDVLNYWSAQAASHASASVSSLSRLQRRKGKTPEEEQRERRFPPLKESASWKMNPAVGAAADSFDSRHLTRLERAERISAAVHAGAAPDSSHKAVAMRKAVFEVAANRFIEPYWRVETKRFVAKAAKVVEAPVVVEEPFDLWTSIWGPRATWCDAKDFYDHEEVRRRRFEIDWQCAIEQLGLVKVILRHDEGDDLADEDGDGLPDEVEEVGATLWECHEVVFLLFIYFAALGSDIHGINFNAWSQFINEVKLASKKSQFCKRQHFDTLFIKIDSASSRYWKSLENDIKAKGMPSSKPAQSDKSKSLSRVEFIGALVHIAIMRYCLTGEYDDVSEALHRLLMKDIVPRVDASISASPNDFRRTQCYTKDVNQVLRKYETSLRHIFAGVAGGGRTGADAKLISLNEWRHFLRAIDFCGGDLTERDGRFAFVWSIMAVADGRTTRGTLRQSCLPFEGFLEALCRMAGLKALPTDEEIAEAGCSHAGTYMAKLKLEDEAAYEKMLAERSTPWSERFSPPQPMARLVEHTCAIMIHSIEAETAGHDNLELSQQEVVTWLKAKNLYGYYDK